MKRILLCLAAVLPLLLCLIFPAAAAEEVTVEDVIIEACIYETTADISQFELTEDELETLIYRLRDSGKLPWYTEESYGYTYNKDTLLILELEPDYLDKEAYNRELYEQRIAEVLDACVFEGMQDWQIALSIHDYLIANCVYDETLELRTGYDLLMKGSTVCSGYTDLYQDLLNRAGVPCVSVISDPMEHTWNLVQIGGKWYHVDLTWDDPTPDSYGLVSHQYFLVSDETIRNGEDPHYDWVTDITCTSDDFADAFFRDTDSAVIYTDSNTCYLLRTEDWNNHIYVRDEKEKKETCIYTDKATYINIGSGEYTYYHYGLSCWNDRLYFCSLSRVHSVKPDGSDLQTEHRYDNWGNKRYLKGCHVAGDTAYLALSDHEGNIVPHTIALKNSGCHTHEYTETVIAPTCTEPGMTTSVCDCGLRAESSPTPTAPHAYEDVERNLATFYRAGSLTQTCADCGDTCTETLPRLSFLGWILQLLDTLKGE